MDDGILKLDFGRIFCKTWPGDSLVPRCPIILVHDSLGSVELWRDLPQKLSETLNRTIIAYDRLGFGKSDSRIDLPLSNFIKDEAEIYFPKIKAALGVIHFGVLGHSAGGSMAVEIGVRDPDCLFTITEAAQSFSEEQTLAGVKKALADASEKKIVERLQKYHGEKAQWVFDFWTRTWLSDEFKNWDLFSDHKRIRQNALVIHGDRDEYGSIAHAQRIYNSIDSHKQLRIFQECGHIPHKERPEDFIRILREFLKQIETSRYE